MDSRVLVGDIGGTNIRFGIAELSETGIVIHDFYKMPGDHFEGFSDALQSYSDEASPNLKSLRACFALAGPVIDGAVQLTNRDWAISGSQIKSQFELPDVRLVNDFTAMARAVPEIVPAELEQIRPGISRTDAPVIVAGPGTGFGVATVLPGRSKGWRVLSGEGGHMAYAPVSDIEIELAQLLRKSHGFVSNELVCAGIGLDAVHRALCEIFDRPYQQTSPGEMLKLAATGDEVFLELCHIRARGTMGAVGDLVLANGAFGGVVLAGGVSERLATYLKAGEALDRFLGIGARARFLSDVPIHLMHDPVAPLIGAAALVLKED